MIERLLNKTIEVYQKSAVSDGQGGWAEEYTLGGSVTGRVRPRSAKEADVGGSERAEITHIAYTLSALVRGDRIVVDGKTFEVLAVRNPSLMGHHFESECREIQTKQNEVVT